MAISNLTTQYISSSFQNLMQVSSSGQIYNGTGTQVTNLVLTSVTASFNGLVSSASSAIIANTANTTTSASYALTASYALNAGGDTSNLATTGSNTFVGNQSVTGNVTVTGTLTANTYVLSSSVTNMTIEYASGSTAFGNSSDDTHTFIGSVTVTGSLVVSGSSTFRNIGPAQFTGSVISTQGFTGSLQGTAISASYAIEAGTALYVRGQDVDGAVSDSDRLGGANPASYVLNTVLTGYVTTSSLASASVATASYIDPTVIVTTITEAGFATTSSIGSSITSTTDTGALITNTFYTVDSTSAPITISLRTNTAGAEFTFFATNLTNDIVFVTGSGCTITSEDSYRKINKVGSAVTAKYYGAATVALIGSLKA
jgi:hypothetical protein